MLSVLFWNMHNRALRDRLAKIVARLSVDLVLLAECGEADAEVCSALSLSAGMQYTAPFSEGNRIRIFTRFPEDAVVDRFNSSQMTIRRVMPPSGNDILLAVVHFQSRVNWDRDDQTLAATVLSNDIVREEDEVGHQRTILVGDLNMNPFDSGVVGAQALHAVMTRALAGRREREVAGRSYRMFYNPMWGHFGDRTPGPPGSYYLRSSKPGQYFWHIYDQVLLRPDLMDRLEEIRILDTDGERTLLTQHGLPNESGSSDHLPIHFRLQV